jgi:hypothetical protein
MNYRHEYKHRITYLDFLVLKQRLSLTAHPDPHAREDGTYHIRSLYFDNYKDKALVEKISGVNNREKFRIRIYNHSTDLIRLEKKSKINGLCLKEETPLSKAECLRILAGQTGWMKNADVPLLCEFYAKMKHHLLRPKVLVDYTRLPFVYEPGNVRITLDYDIRTGLVDTRLFDVDTPTVPVPDNAMILEVKYDAFLPDVMRDMIELWDRQTTSFSKYAACRMYY